MGRKAIMRWIALGVFFLWLGTLPSRAVAGDAAKRPGSVLRAVAGLDQPVTYTETKIPLGELIAKVAADTHVALGAAPDVADEPVAVVVQALPARELLEQIADLLDYRWSVRRVGDREAERSGKGGKEGRGAESPRPNAQGPTPNAPRPTPSFEIWQDLASKQREETLRRAVTGAAEERFRQEVARAVQMAGFSQPQIDAIVAANEREHQRRRGLSPEQRGAIEESPEEKKRALWAGTAYRLRAPMARVSAKLVGRLTPRQWSELLQERQSIAFSTQPTAGELPLPPDLARTIRETRPEPVERHMAAGNAALDEHLRRREQELRDQWAAATGFRVTVSHGGGLTGRGSLAVQVGVQPIRSGAPFRSISFGLDNGTWLIFSDGAPDVRPESELLRPERLAAMAKDPVFGIQKPFKTEALPPAGDEDAAWKLQELLPDLARAYGVQFLADAYWNAPSFGPVRSLEKKPTALFALLDQWVSYAYTWDRREKLIRLRSRTWYFDRPREIPLRLARRWQALYERDGGLSLDEYAASVAALPEAQSEGLRDVEEHLRLPGLDVHSQRLFLRLYGELLLAQRQALWQGVSLPVAQLSPDQRDLFLAAAKGIRNGWGFNNVALPDLSRWGDGRLTLTASPMVRIRERHGTSSRYQDEAAAPPDTPLRPPARPPSPPAAPAADAGNTTRFPMTRIELALDCGAERPLRHSLVVAAPPSRAALPDPPGAR
jgi:hypothetical protein